MIIFACNLDKIFTSEPVGLKQLIESSFCGENIEGKYANLEIDLLTEYFAEYEDSYEKEIFHVAYDKDGYMYIVSFSEQDSESFENIIEYINGKIGEKPNSVLVEGVVEKLPDSFNKILKESFELNSDEELVNYFGGVYLNTQKSANEDNRNFLIGLAVIIIFIDLRIIRNRRRE